MDNYKPNQPVRVLTIQVAVPSYTDEGDLADAMSAILTGAMCDKNTVVLDWQYLTPIDQSPVVRLDAKPEEGDAFALLDPRCYSGPAYMSDLLYAHMDGNRCPVCGSEEISSGHIHALEGGGERSCSCDTCQSEWTESFALDGYCDLGPVLPPDTLVRVTARYDWPNGTIGEQRWYTRQEWATEDRVLQYLSRFLSEPVVLTNWWTDPL